MNYKTLIQPPTANENQTFASHLADLGKNTEYKRISVAVAYSTVAGITALRELIEVASPSIHYRWLLGLDDYITQPGAIRECQSLPSSDVRIYQSKKQGTRFHPKLYMLEPRKSAENLISIIGSSNLTRAALRFNCEANTLLRAARKVDRRGLMKGFTDLWKIGVKPTSSLLESYETEYKKRRPLYQKLDAMGKKRHTPKPTSNLILATDNAEIGPASAKVCWIEVGKATAQGRELEFKAEQAAFFGLNPGGGDAKHFNFILTDGKHVTMRMKYQGNHMWRLQLISEVPEVAQGLRRKYGGKLARSPYVAVFERTTEANSYRLAFKNNNSQETIQLKGKSKKMGTLGQTSARAYGWI